MDFTFNHTAMISTLESRLSELTSIAHQIYNKSILPWVPNTLLLAFIAIITVLSTRIMSGERLKSKASHVGQQTVPTLPYWIPYMGHAFGFALWPNKLLSRVRETFPDGIFSLLVGGTKINIVYTPQLMHNVFAQRPTNAEFSSITIYICFSIFGTPKRYKAQVIKALPSLHALFDKNMLREPELGRLSRIMARNLEQNLPHLVGFVESPVDMTPWERPAGVRNAVGRDRKVAVEANLLNLVFHFIGHAALPSIFGSDLLEAEPNVLEDLFTFNEAFLLIAAGLPRWIPHPKLSSGYAARARVIDSLTRWHEAQDAHLDMGSVPTSFSNIDDISPLMKARKTIYRAHSIPPSAAAALDLSILWALMANSNFLAFWMLMRMFYDADEGGQILQNVRKEVAQYVQVSQPEPSGLPISEQPNIKIDVDGLLRKCPLLKGVYIESLRLDSAPWSFKRVVKDFSLPISRSEQDDGNKTASDISNSVDSSDSTSSPLKASYRIPKDSYIATATSLHFTSPSAFPDPLHFNPIRHINPDTKTAEYGTVYPYGGGSNICKGRLFAEREVLACVAGLIVLWEFESAKKDRKWRMPKVKRGTGVMMVGEEVWARIVRRG